MNVHVNKYQLYFIFTLLFVVFLPILSTAEANTALNFNSNDDYAEIPHAAHYDVGTGNFTVSCFCRFEQVSTSHQMELVIKGIGNDNIFVLEYSSGENQRFYFGGRGDLVEWNAGISNYIPDLDTWFHVAGVRNGDDFHFYLIRISDLQVLVHEIQHLPGVGNPTNAVPFIVGDGELYNREFIGDIDELRFWNRALDLGELVSYSQTEVNPVDESLLGYWKCNEGSGSILTDSSNYGNSGELFGTVNYVPATWTTPEFPLTISITPDQSPVVIPSVGGSFLFHGTIENTTQGVFVSDAWLSIILPNGNEFGPTFQVQSLYVQPSQIINFTMIQFVPSFAPAGVYQYVANLGILPLAQASDSFEFTKVGVQESTNATWRVDVISNRRSIVPESE